MKKQYFKIDLKTGQILDSAVFDSEVDDIPTDYELGWGNDVFYEPYYDLENNEWAEGKGQNDILNDIKAAHILDLKVQCEKEIEKGFIATNGHLYRTNRDDQLNMIGQRDELLSDNTITKVLWSTEDGGYIEHSRDDWLSIYNQAFQHKKEKLLKYERLKTEVNNATSREEVKAIVWSG